jgi:hypothetical protein
MNPRNEPSDQTIILDPDDRTSADHAFCLSEFGSGHYNTPDWRALFAASAGLAEHGVAAEDAARM